jgi:sec-independent protein translocase protein TatA
MPMGGTELLIILVIILLFFGAKRVPELGRSFGKSMRELRKEVSSGSDDKLEEPKKREKLPADEHDSPEEARVQVEGKDARDEWHTERKT